MSAHDAYIAAGRDIRGAAESQLFGKRCFKLNGKAFVCFFQECMVFKLADEAYKAALRLDGAQLFDPSGKGRPMKEWVQLPFDYADQWPYFAQKAAESIGAL